MNATSFNVVSTSPILHLTNITDGGLYIVVVINYAGYEVFTWSVYLYPVILKEPEDLLTMITDSVSLSVEVDGSPSPMVQWQKLNSNGIYEDLPGENMTTLYFMSIGYSDAGLYRCLVTSIVNGTGLTTMSREAIISGILYMT